MNETWWRKARELDEHQRAIIEMPLKDSHLIQGPPGSGKTNLLLLRAHYLTRAGRPNVRILVFTRNLREFIASGASGYAFSPDKVSTARQWQYQILRANGAIPKDLPSAFDAHRRALNEATQAVVNKARITQLCDVLLLDEAQDYLPEEITLFRGLCTDIYAVADLRQKIYDGQSPIELLHDLTDEQHTLRFHYRNGVKICEVADGIGVGAGFEPMSPTCNYPEADNPSSVSIQQHDDMQAQCNAVAESLSVQRRAFPNEMLGVLAPRRQEVDAIWNALSETDHGAVAVKQTFDDGYCALGPNVQVCVCTIHGAKGLEFRAVHVVGTEFLSRFSMQRKMAFTAVTRAKTSLTLHHIGALPGYLEEALAVIGPKPSLPTLEDIL